MKKIYLKKIKAVSNFSCHAIIEGKVIKCYCSGHRKNEKILQLCNNCGFNDDIIYVRVPNPHKEVSKSTQQNIVDKLNKGHGKIQKIRKYQEAISKLFSEAIDEVYNDLIQSKDKK